MRIHEKIKALLNLYLVFLKIGTFTFGGGLNIVAQIQRIYVDTTKHFSEEDILDAYCIGKSIPGTMVTNVSFLIGFQLEGRLGGFAAVLGLITSPTIILILVAIFYDSMKDNPYIAKAMIGVRIAVVPVILSAVLKMLKPAFPHLICILIAVAAFSAFFFLNINSLLIVGFGALVGYFFSALQEREK